MSFAIFSLALTYARFFFCNFLSNRFRWYFGFAAFGFFNYPMESVLKFFFHLYFEALLKTQVKHSKNVAKKFSVVLIAVLISLSTQCVLPLIVRRMGRNAFEKGESHTILWCSRKKKIRDEKKRPKTFSCLFVTEFCGKISLNIHTFSWLCMLPWYRRDENGFKFARIIILYLLYKKNE